MYDLAVSGGNVYLDGRWVETNVYVNDGRVAALSPDVLPALRSEDVGGLNVMPGLIDAHVHFAMQSGAYTTVDDFASGSEAAARGGVTTVIDFLDERATAAGMEAEFERKLALAADSCVDFGLHAAVCELEDDAEVMAKTARSLGSSTLKLYTTYKPAAYASWQTVSRLIALSSRQHLLILCHAEDDDLLSQGDDRVASLGRNRPVAAETEAVRHIAALVRELAGQAYIVHTSAGSTVEMLSREYPDLLGRTLFLEATPHHLLLNDSFYATAEAWQYTMAPPLRPEAERRELNRHWRDLSVFATDHCAFAAADKNRTALSSIPMGVGGVGHLFGLMYDAFGDAAIDRLTLNPAVLHGLYPAKGSLRVGSDADLVAFACTGAHRPAAGHGRTDADIFAGIPVSTTVELVLSRGKRLIKNGKTYGSRGKYMKRTLLPKAASHLAKGSHAATKAERSAG